MTFKHTKIACYIGYVVQAIINNFAPLLFVTFQKEFGITLSQLTLVTALNFIIQLLSDIFSAKFADKIGYRTTMLISQAASVLGLVSYSILPYLINSAFTGLIISAVLCAVGGGLVEVLISPIMEGCPSESKSGSMSLLHSFYCWRQAGVIGFSTLFFAIFGRGAWRYVSLLWAVIPLLNILLFSKVPIRLTVEKDNQTEPSRLMSNGAFKILIILMLGAGASELAMSQWASAFAENALNITKTVGDIIGPCLFGVLMGFSRIFYSAFSKKINLIKFMLYSGILCIFSYLTASLSPIPILSLIGCAVCGLSCGIMWPGTISLAAKLCPSGGTFMFGTLALAGDIGCIIGTMSVGAVSGIFGDNLKKGLMFATIFPIVTIIGAILCIISEKKKK